MLPNKMEKVAALLLFFVLLISIIPMIMVACYEHPMADDYSYSIDTYHCEKDGGRIMDVLIAAWKDAIQTYKSWQGTFTACFLMALQPAAFSEDAYFLTTVILLGLFCCGTYAIISSFVCNVCKSNRSIAVIISVVVIELSIQFVPDAQEGFFWFNGGIYYTFFYSMALLLCSGILTATSKNKIGKAEIVVWSLFAAIIGGGNYTTALALFVFLLYVCIITQKKEKVFSALCLIACVYTISFLVSVLAPGNALRGAELSDNKTSAFYAILHSLLYAAQSVIYWTKLPQIAAMILLIPLFLKISNGCSWTFHKPVLVTFFAFGCFASQFTPPLYAMGTIGPGRNINIYYFSYYLLISFLLFYYCGWMQRKYPVIYNIRKQIKRKKVVWNTAIFFVSIITFLCGVYMQGDTNWYNTLTVVSLRTIMNGTAEEYDTQYSAILEKLKTESDICVVNDITVKSPVLNAIGLDSEGGENYWINESLAQYFNHGKVLLQTSS